MNKIKLLPNEIVAKIAAGEVIERPVYAIKELVENALDAHADTVTIHVEESGLKKITVIDNGEGMSDEDIKECFKLHTTSKVTSIENLSHIESLGFRGEALASIAAISNLTIQSRQKTASAGTCIEVSSGKIGEAIPVGMPAGTTVIVSNLFSSVPGRKKFLKSEKTEFRHIISLITNIALANPQVHFMLTHNKKVIFDLPKTSDIFERVKFIFSKNIIPNLLPISYQNNYVTISGFISNSHLTHTTTNKQYLFVNNRSIVDKTLSTAVKEGYGTRIPSPKYPVFVLFISLPYEFVDVNVHPRKEHIRFADTKQLLENIQKAVDEMLTKHNTSLYDETGFGFSLRDNSSNSTHSFAGRLLKENQMPWDVRSKNEIRPYTEAMQLHNVYLITQTKFGIVLVDQHAAHERILYEQFMDAFKKEKLDSPQYNFDKPIILELSPTENALLEEHQDFLDKAGFEISEFKGNAFRVDAIPLLFQDRKPKELITELLEDLEQGTNTDVDKTNTKMIAYLACRGAIKAGESLTKKQAKELLEKLEQTNNNSTCPHGRPTKIIIDIDNLHRMFKRK